MYVSVPAFQTVYMLVQDFETVSAGLRQCRYGLVQD